MGVMAEPGMEGVAFEAVTLLPGFARLVKRSGEKSETRSLG